MCGTDPFTILGDEEPLVNYAKGIARENRERRNRESPHNAGTRRPRHGSGQCECATARQSQPRREAEGESRGGDFGCDPGAAGLTERGALLREFLTVA